MCANSSTDNLLTWTHNLYDNSNEQSLSIKSIWKSKIAFLFLLVDLENSNHEYIIEICYLATRIDKKIITCQYFPELLRYLPGL